MALDPTTPIGKVRLRIGDIQDLPILPDAVIQGALDDNDGSVYKAAALCAQYILATLSFKSHKKLAQLETWSGEQFKNYKDFLTMTILNPHLSSVAPIPYSGCGLSTDGAIQQFLQDWKDGYLSGSVVIPPQQGGRVIEYAF